MLTQLIEEMSPARKIDFEYLLDAMRQDFHMIEYNDDDVHEIYEEDALDGYIWHCGMSKFCVDYDTFVLKKGFNGTFVETDEYGGMLNPEDFYYNFWDINYGDLEYEVYKKAKEEGVERFFAEMVSLGDGIYAQEKSWRSIYDCEFTNHMPEGFKDWDWLCKVNNHDINQILADCKKHGINPFPHIRDDALPYLYYYLSYDELGILTEFLRHYDINDIHTNNVGFFISEDGGVSIKLFDYSGYRSSTKEILKD